MSRIQGLVFDFDGVLGDTVGAHTKARKRSFESNGYYVSPEIHKEGHRHGSTPPVIICWILKTAGYIPEDADPSHPVVKKIVADKQKLYRVKSAQGMDAVSGSVELVNWAANHYSPSRLAIATTATLEHEVMPYLGRYELTDKVGQIVSHEDTPEARLKPDPFVYEQAAIKLGIDPVHLAAIEDTPNGVISASDAGYGLVIGLASSFSHDDLARADAVCDNLSQVPNILNAA